MPSSTANEKRTAMRGLGDSLISQPKRRDWRRWGFKSKPPSKHGCTGARFMEPIPRAIKWS